MQSESRAPKVLYFRTGAIYYRRHSLCHPLRRQYAHCLYVYVCVRACLFDSCGRVWMCVAVCRCVWNCFCGSMRGLTWMCTEASRIVCVCVQKEWRSGMLTSMPRTPTFPPSCTALDGDNVWRYDSRRPRSIHDRFPTATCCR